MTFTAYEKDYRKKGSKLIAGIDEVGRGSLFGDVLSCAIIMKEDSNIEGVNDSKKYMDKLVDLLKNRNCLLNLITLNPIEEFNQKSPDRNKMMEFMNYMNKNNVNTTIRRKQGIDIEGACGQLRINNMTKRGVEWNMLQAQISDW